MASTTDTLRNFIDGELVGAEGETEPVLNPATGEEIARAPRSSAQEVDRAVAAARRAFEGWSQTTPQRRSEALLDVGRQEIEHLDSQDGEADRGDPGRHSGGPDRVARQAAGASL